VGQQTRFLAQALALQLMHAEVPCQLSSQQNLQQGQACGRGVHLSSGFLLKQFQRHAAQSRYVELQSVRLVEQPRRARLAGALLRQHRVDLRGHEGAARDGLWAPAALASRLLPPHKLGQGERGSQRIHRLQHGAASEQRSSIRREKGAKDALVA